MTFLAQLIGCLAVSLWVMSLQNKDRKNILIFQGFANLLYIVEYSLLGAFSASSMNFISMLRCFIFSNKDENKTKKWSYFFLLLIIILGIITYDGILSLIPIIITCFYTLSSSKNDAKWNRIAVLISGFIWIYYNFTVGAYITIIGNFLEIISGITSLIRFNTKH